MAARSASKPLPEKLRPYAHHLRRVRNICRALPDTEEKMSHGEVTFFANKRVFAAFSNNHHGDGHLAVVLPAAPGLQAALIEEAPHAYYRPPYVGSRGWIGLELNQITDQALEAHIRQAWQLVTTKTKSKQRTK